MFHVCVAPDDSVTCFNVAGAKKPFWKGHTTLLSKRCVMQAVCFVCLFVHLLFVFVLHFVTTPFPDQCIVSHFKPHKIKKALSKNFNGLLDVSTSRALACLFVEDEGQEENDQKVSRTVSVNEKFAQQHPAAVDSFSSFDLELRKSCLRRVMKCVVASEQSKSTLLKVKDIHATKGRAVLEVVQVQQIRYMCNSIQL